MAIACLGNVHVHSNVMLTGHHFGWTTRSSLAPVNPPAGQRPTGWRDIPRNRRAASVSQFWPMPAMLTSFQGEPSGARHPPQKKGRLSATQVGGDQGRRRQIVASNSELDPQERAVPPD